MKFVLTILLVLLRTAAVCPQISVTEIDGLYNFAPHKLSRDEQKDKLPALDDFWEKVKKDTSRHLASLREALLSEGRSPYFYYDGAKLLLSISRSEADQLVALSAIEKCDLKDIEGSDYVRTINWIAGNRLNVTRAALKILEEEKFSAFIPQHALTLPKEYCLMFLMLPMHHDQYFEELKHSFSTLKYKNSRTAALTVLAHVPTCAADSMIQSIARYDTSLTRFITSLQDNLVLKDEEQLNSNEYLKEYVALYSSRTLNELIELRCQSARRVSDEALYEIALITHYMLKRRDCR